MSNFLNMQKMLLKNQLSVKDKFRVVVEGAEEDTPPAETPKASPDELPEKSVKKPKVDTSWQDVMGRLAAIRTSHHNVQVSDSPTGQKGLLSYISATLYALKSVKKTESVDSLVVYLKNLKSEIEGATSSFNQSGAIVSNLELMKSEITKIIKRSDALSKKKLPGKKEEIFDPKIQDVRDVKGATSFTGSNADVEVERKMDEWIDRFGSPLMSHVQVNDKLAKILKKVLSKAKTKAPQGFATICETLIQEEIQKVTGQRTEVRSFAVFPAEKPKVDTDDDDTPVFHAPGAITSTLPNIYEKLNSLNTEFRDSDGKVDTDAKNAVNSLQAFILDQADIISNHYERRNKLDIKAAVTDPKEINKVLISSPAPDVTKLVKNKSIWDYTSDITSDNAETLSDAIDALKGLFENAQHSAKKLTNKETQQPIWKFVEPFFFVGMKEQNPDFLKLGLYFITDELFRQIIARRELVMLIKNSELHKKNRYLYNIAYAAQQKTQAAIIKEPNLLYWAMRVKTAAQKDGVFKQLTNALSVVYTEVLKIPADFFVDSLNNEAETNIADQLYYSLISTYGSQADLQRLEKAPGNPKGEEFLVPEAKSQLEKDIAELLNSRKFGESLTGRVKTKLTAPLAKVASIAGILRTRGKVSDNVNRAIGEGLDTDSILKVVEACKDLKGSAQVEKFKTDLFLNLQKALDEVDETGNLSLHLPIHGEAAPDPNTEKGKEALEWESKARVELVDRLQKELDKLEGEKVLVVNTRRALEIDLAAIVSRRNEMGGGLVKPEKPVEPKKPRKPEKPSDTQMQIEVFRKDYEDKLKEYEEYKKTGYAKALGAFRAADAKYPTLLADWEAKRKEFFTDKEVPEGKDESATDRAKRLGIHSINKEFNDKSDDLENSKTKLRRLQNKISQLNAEISEADEYSDEFEDDGKTRKKKSRLEGSALAVSSGPGGAITDTVKAIQSLTEVDIAKIVKVLSANKELSTFSHNRISPIKLSPSQMSKLAEVYNDIKAIVEAHDGDAASILPRMERFKHAFMSGNITRNTISTFVSIIESSRHLASNSQISTYIVVLENLLDLPTQAKELDLESEQFVQIKDAIKELVRHRNLADVYKDKLRTKGFDLVLHDFDTFIKQWNGYFADINARRADTEAAQKKSLATAGSVRDIAFAAQAEKERQMNMSRVLLGGSTITGDVVITSPEQRKIIFLQNMTQFSQNAKILYTMIKELLETNPKLKKYITKGTGTFDVGDTADATEEELRAFDTFNALATGKVLKLASEGNTEPLDKTSDEFWAESGISDEYRPYILTRLKEKATLSTKGPQEFNADIYDVFKKVIAFFQKRLSTRPPELASEAPIEEAEGVKKTKTSITRVPKDVDQSRLKGELSKEEAEFLTTQNELGFSTELSDVQAVNILRMLKDDEVESVLSEFIPGKTKSELLKIRNTIQPHDTRMERYKSSMEAYKIGVERYKVAQASGDHSIKAPAKMPERPEPAPGPFFKDLFSNKEEKVACKDALREHIRKTQVLELPAFKVFTQVLRRAIDSGNIRNPIRLEVQSSAANLDHKVSAFLNLAAGIVEYKDIHNFLMGSIGRNSSVVDTLFDATAYPISITQDRSIVLCTRLYILRALIEAGKLGNLVTEFEQVKVHFASEVTLDAEGDITGEDKKGIDLNASAQKTFKEQIADPIITAFTADGTLEKEYTKSLTLLKESIEGSNRVVPILGRTGDTFSKEIIDTSDDAAVLALIRSRGSVALDLMKTSTKVPDSLKGLISDLKDEAKLGTKLANCVKIIVSGINYILGRELVAEMAKIAGLDERQEVESYDADPSWEQFTSAFKIAKKGLPEPTLVAVSSDSSTGYHNLNNKYLSIFLREFSNTFENVRRLEKDKEVAQAEVESNEELGSQREAVNKLPVSIEGIFISKDTDPITGTVSSLSTPRGKVLSRGAAEKSDRGAIKTIAGEKAPIAIVTPREAREGEKIKDSLHGEAYEAAPGQMVVDISCKPEIDELNPRKNVTSDILAGYRLSATQKSKHKAGPLKKAETVKSLSLYHADLRAVLDDVVKIFAKAASGFENAEKVKEDLFAFNRNVISATNNIERAFTTGVFSDGYLDLSDPQKQAQSLSALKYIPFPITKHVAALPGEGSESRIGESFNGVVSALNPFDLHTRLEELDIVKNEKGEELFGKRKEENLTDYDNLKDYYDRFLGLEGVVKGKRVKDETVRVLWAEVINDLIIKGSNTGAEVMNQFKQLFKAAAVPSGAVKKTFEKSSVAKKPVRTAIELTTDESRAAFKAKFLESFFGVVSDPVILVNSVVEALQQIDVNSPSEDEVRLSIPVDGETDEQKALRENLLKQATTARTEKWDAIANSRKVTKDIIKRFLHNVVVTVETMATKTVEGYKAKAKGGYMVSGQKATPATYDVLANIFENRILPILNHMSAVIALDGLADGSIKQKLDSLAVNINKIKVDLDKKKPTAAQNPAQPEAPEAPVVENLIYVALAQFFEAADPVVKKDTTGSLDDLVAFYRFKNKDRILPTSGAKEYEDIFNEVRRDFMAVFIFDVLPKIPAFMKWKNIAKRTEPYIRFRVLPELKIELQTGRSVDEAELFSSTEDGKMEFRRTFLNVPINDFETLGWLASHVLTNKQYEVPTPTEEPPVEPPTE